MSSGPTRVIVAGDWHGNGPWAADVIGDAARLLDGEARPTILQLGDFGIWSGDFGLDFIEAAATATTEHGVDVCFIDGNHEDHDLLALIAAGKVHPDGTSHPPHSLAPGVWWLPRGYRWQWHGRTWLAMGGGVSLDRRARVEGRDWWPEEEITAAQEAEAIAGGHSDVLLCHDCPSGVRHALSPPPAWWDPRDMARSDAHQERLQRIADAVRPSHVIHGHLHMAYSRTCDFGYGPVQVTGLHKDDEPGNYAVLDVKTMTWEPS